MGEIHLKPPYCNTGAENTERHALFALVDWVSCTFPYAQDVQEILNILCLPEKDMREMPHGLHGYKQMLICGNIRVMYDGNDNMGIHVEFSGQGCREYESYNLLTWSELIKRVTDRGGHFSRLDVAIDDYKGYFTIQSLIRRSKRGLCRSKFKKARYMETIELSDGSTGGATIYFGNPSSRIKIRMYEKNFEREQKGFDVEEDVHIWNRVEIEAKKERAQILALLIMEERLPLGSIICGVLKNYVNFVDKHPTDPNKARWEVSKFWKKFLGDIEPIRLTEKAPDRTIQRVENWIDKQVTPSISLLFLAGVLNHENLQEFLSEGLDRLTEKDIIILEQFQREKRKYDSISEEVRNGLQIIDSLRKRKEKKIVSSEEDTKIRF